MTVLDLSGPRPEPEPEPGDVVTVTYFSVQGGGRNHMTGDVAAYTPTPEGWRIRVDPHDTDGPRKIHARGDVADVKGPTGSAHAPETMATLGGVAVTEDSPLTIERGPDA